MNRRRFCRAAVAALLAVVCAFSVFAAPVKRVFTTQDLEEIRAVAIQYLQTKKPEAWQNYLVELRRGAIFLEKDYPGVGPAIGLWRIEIELGEIALVRQPR